MRTQLLRLGLAATTLVLVAAPVSAHPAPGFHVHAGEIGGLAAASLVMLAVLLFRRAKSR